MYELYQLPVLRARAGDYFFEAELRQKASKPAHEIRPQRPLPSHRFTQLQQQFVFVPGQIPGERQRIGGMVAAEDDWLRRVEAADQSFLFPEYREIIQCLEGLAEFFVEFCF